MKQRKMAAMPLLLIVSLCLSMVLSIALPAGTARAEEEQTTYGGASAHYAMGNALDAGAYDITTPLAISMTWNSLKSQDDHDFWIKYTAPQDGIFEARYASMKSLDVSYQFDDGTKIYTFSGTFQQTTRIGLAKGTTIYIDYYFLNTNAYTRNNAATSTLTFTPDAEVEHEPNNTFSQATPLTQGNWRTMITNSTSDRDYISLSLLGGHEYGILVKGDYEKAAPAIYLFESDRNKNYYLNDALSYLGAIDGESVYGCSFTAGRTGTHYLCSLGGNLGYDFAFGFEDITEESSDSGGGSGSAENDAPGTMYRLYNRSSGEHFYTANAGERDSLVGIGWVYEGVAWTAPLSSNTPVYRLYNPNSSAHHYTSNSGERDVLISIGWKDEGIGWYSDDARTTPLYRLFNPNAVGAQEPGAHHYTTSLSERDYLISIGWNNEDIGWYGK